jgi:hypothetical protein
MDENLGLLGGTTRKLNDMVAVGGNMSMCYLIWGFVAIFLVMWYGFLK